MIGLNTNTVPGAEDFYRFYSSPGIMTDPGEYASFLDPLQGGIPELCKTVQGLFLHLHWAEGYGVKLSEERKAEANLRTVTRQIGGIRNLDASPLIVPRPVEKRVIGTCRDFSTFLCAILRHRGVPARARCGFGTYFRPGRNEDHWVCEYWREDQQRWVMVDSQLDLLQRKALGLAFNPADMPPGKFIIAGEAWQMCRRGEADPETFGIFDMHGWWFIASNVVRDLLSLNKVELLPWDDWPYMTRWQAGREISPEDMTWLDQIAEVTLDGNKTFTTARSIFQRDQRLCPAPDWQP